MSRFLVVCSLLLAVVFPAMAKSPIPENHPSVSVISNLEEAHKMVGTALDLLQGKNPTAKEIEVALDLLKRAQKAIGSANGDVKKWAQEEVQVCPKCEEPRRPEGGKGNKGECPKVEACPKCEVCVKCGPCPPCDRCDDGKKGKKPEKCGVCPPCERCKRCDDDQGEGHGQSDGHGKGHGHDKKCHCDDPKEPLPPPPTPMDPPAFQSLTEQIEREGFEDGKVAVLSTAAGYAWFTVAQVRSLLDLFPFSSGKLKVLAVVRPRILDMDKSFQLFEAFPFDSDKAKAKAILDGGN